MSTLIVSAISFGMSRPLPFEVRAAIVELIINQYSYFIALSSVFHTSCLLCAIFHSLAYQLLLGLSNQTINSKILACEVNTLLTAQVHLRPLYL